MPPLPKKERFLDWTYAHPWTVIYLCVVVTANLILLLFQEFS